MRFHFHFHFHQSQLFFFRYAKCKGAFHRTLDAIKTLVAVAEGVDLEVRWRTATSFCYEEEKWCAKLENVEPWNERATHHVRRIRFKWIMVNEAILVRLDGETEMETVHPRHTENIVASNMNNCRIVKSWRFQQGELSIRSQGNKGTAGFFLGKQGHSEGAFLCNWPNDMCQRRGTKVRASA